MIDDKLFNCLLSALFCVFLVVATFCLMCLPIAVLMKLHNKHNDVAQQQQIEPNQGVTWAPGFSARCERCGAMWESPY